MSVGLSTALFSCWKSKEEEKRLAFYTENARRARKTEKAIFWMKSRYFLVNQ